MLRKIFIENQIKRMSHIIEKAEELYKFNVIYGEDVAYLKRFFTKNPEKEPKTKEEADVFLEKYIKHVYYANVKSIKKNVQFFFWLIIIGLIILIISSLLDAFI